MTCGRFVLSLYTPVSSTNKTYLHDIAEILLKVAVSNITLTQQHLSTTVYTCCMYAIY